MYYLERLLIYGEKFKFHRKHCRIKSNAKSYKLAYSQLFIHQLIKFALIQLILISELNAQSIIKQTTNVQQTSLNSKSSLASSIKNAYTVYPQIENLLDSDAFIPCNISHSKEDTLLMILVYYNPRIRSSNNITSKPIALTSGPPIFSLDLRMHSQYIHRYLHQNKIFQDKFKHQIKREINLSNLEINLNQASDSIRMLNSDSNFVNRELDSDLNRDLDQLFKDHDYRDLNSRDFSMSSIKNNFKVPFRDASAVHNDLNQNINRDLNEDRVYIDVNSRMIRRSRDLDDTKAAELLTSAQFISSPYTGRLTFNFSANREQLILKLSKLKEQDAGEYVCRTDYKWSRTKIAVVNLFVIDHFKEIEIELSDQMRSEEAIVGKRCPDVIPLRVDTLDSTYINYNKPMVDCFKKTNLVTFSNQKIELICSDDDPINITLKNPYETTSYAYNENGNFTLSTTV